MKPFAVFCVLAFGAAMCVPMAASAHRSFHVSHRCDDNDHLFRDGDVDVDFEDGSIIFTHEHDETVEMTEDGSLTVNGRPVRLTREQRRLVEEYYETFDGIVEEAKQIGIEGARIGVRGARLGLSAVVGALLLISDDRDAHDLQIELDRKGEKIERMAERLEKRAKKLEARAERLEDQHDTLRRKIDELDDLGWF